MNAMRAPPPPPPDRPAPTAPGTSGDPSETLALIGSIATLAALFSVSIAARLTMIILLWRWYVGPLFLVNDLTWRDAFGLTLLAGILSAPRSLQEDAEKPVRRKFIDAICFASLGIALGWLGTFLP